MPFGNHHDVTQRHLGVADPLLRYQVRPPQASLERASFLDDEDRHWWGRRRGDHNRLGFALQVTTVRYLGTFLIQAHHRPNPTAATRDIRQNRV